MARIAGVDIPNHKKVDVSLRSIYGIGSSHALGICKTTGISEDTKVRDLTEEELSKLREVIDKNYIVEGDLRREVNGNIRRLVEIGCYRGIRHRRGLPVHGQRTRTNARTKRGARKTVAGRRRASAKK
jgi:small subunit ribosomal protein S13